MARPDKAATVAELTTKLSDSAAAVLTEYRGLSVKDLKQLRRSLGDDATYAIAKNTLTQIAARQAGIDGLEEHLTGPTAITFITGDIATVAKGLRDFAKDHPALVLKAGYMDGRVLDAETVKKLADLESREVLLSKLAGALMASLSQAVRLFAAPLGQAARAFGALAEARAEDSAPVEAGAEDSAPAQGDPTVDTSDSATVAAADTAAPAASPASPAPSEPVVSAADAADPTTAADAATE
ncbi:MAG: 50S ribosomal protein L10 [Propionibacteriaceae bacterium]|jgi:large subunit ribosomal protein L10|nr:50S ribosomal protein L10 [Propionibacteriaceae bacterium]